MKHRTGQKRPWLAALLAIVYPGLGHVYLREWFRALLWFGLAITTLSLLVPAAAMPATDGVSLQALLEASQRVPREARIALFGIVLLSVFDAYRLATLENRKAETAAGGRCPHCGHDLEEGYDLEFCHWCTARLDESRPEPEADSGPRL